jgi:hypothetical protein
MRNHKCGCGHNSCNSCNPCNNQKGKAPCCPANIPDSVFQSFVTAIDACATPGPADPFTALFAPDALGLIALFLPGVCGPATQYYNLEEILANRAVFCANTLSRQHTITSIDRHSVGPCDLTVVINTDIVLEFAPGLGITGTQEIKLKFNEDCKIATYVVNTFGTFGPIGGAPTAVGLRAATPQNDPRIENALRALGKRA